MNPLKTDIEAERALLARLLARPSEIGEAAQRVTPADFVHPVHRDLFAAQVSLWSSGAPADYAGVREQVRKLTLGSTIDDEPAVDRILRELASSAEGLVPLRTITAALVRHSVERQVGQVLAETRSELDAATYDDPAELVDVLRARLDEVMVPSEGPPAGFATVADYLSQPPPAESGWVIPGLLRRRWRVLAVAPEGYGKSMLLRQLAIAAAAGIHPLRHDAAIPPVRTLLVDLENPDELLWSVLADLNMKAGEVGDRAALWHRPAGIDLRSRKGRGELEGAIAAHRPDLVAMGPLYKAHTRSNRDSDEVIARDLMEAFDELRVRYGFALVLEHHAPKKSGGSRDLDPRGSGYWLGWPELGLALTPAENDRDLEVRRFRHDRVKSAWPAELHRGRIWPWDGYWSSRSEAETPEELF